MLLEEQDKVRALLREAVTVLCKNGLTFDSELTVEGLLGVTLDNKEVFLVNINEQIKHSNGSTAKEAHGITLQDPQNVTSSNKPTSSGSKVRKRVRDAPSAGFGSQPVSEEPGIKKTKDGIGMDTDKAHDGNPKQEVKLEKNEQKDTGNAVPNVCFYRYDKLTLVYFFITDRKRCCS